MQRKVIALTILGILTLPAFATNEMPRADQRQEKQQQRIEQGVESGQLTQREAHKLNAQQQHIEKAEERMKADGVVTSKERARLHHKENKASRNIQHKKHNNRHNS